MNNIIVGKQILHTCNLDHFFRFRNATNHQSQYDIGGISRSSCFNKDDDGNGFVYSGHLLVPAYRIGCRGGRHNNHKE